MNYDDWLAHNPDDDYEGEKECKFCGNPVSDLSEKEFCSKQCEIAYWND